MATVAHSEFAIEKVGDEKDKEGADDPSYEVIFSALVDEQSQRDTQRKPGDPDDFFEGEARRQPRGQREAGVVQSTQSGLQEQSDAANQSDEGGRCHYNSGARVPISLNQFGHGCLNRSAKAVRDHQVVWSLIDTSPYVTVELPTAQANTTYVLSISLLRLVSAANALKVLLRGTGQIE